MPSPETARENGKKGGRPAGSLNLSTVDKALKLEVLREIVSQHLEAMVKAQIEHAQGVSYMILRHNDGSFARATDEKQIDAACAAGEHAFRIFTQAPNTQAFTDLMNRTFGKPPERMEVTGADGGPIEIVERLAAARQRLALCG